MRTIFSALLAGAMLCAAGATAMATDLMSVVTPAPRAMAYDGDSPFDGFFVGKFGGSELCGICSQNFEFGKAIGVNFVTDSGFVLGMEARVANIGGPGDPFDGLSVFKFGKLGFVLGERAMIYALAGVGDFYEYGGGWTPDFWYRLGAGIEFAVTDALSLRADVTNLQCFAGSCAPPLAYVSAGAVWHFN